MDHESGRVWSDALRDKPVLRGEGRMRKGVALDVDNAGRKDAKIMIKSDQEASCQTEEDQAKG